MRFHTARRKPPVIQIVSLIDILAILLIFFIVTTTFKSEEPQIQIVLPESKTAIETPADKAPVLLVVTKDGRIAIGKQFFDDDAALVAELKRIKADGETGNIAMKADDGAPFGSIIKVIDAMQEAGFDNLPTFAKPPGTP